MRSPLLVLVGSEKTKQGLTSNGLQTESVGITLQCMEDDLYATRFPDELLVVFVCLSQHSQGSTAYLLDAGLLSILTHRAYDTLQATSACDVQLVIQVLVRQACKCHAGTLLHGKLPAAMHRDASFLGDLRLNRRLLVCNRSNSHAALLQDAGSQWVTVDRRKGSLHAKRFKHLQGFNDNELQKPAKNVASDVSARNRRRVSARAARIPVLTREGIPQGDGVGSGERNTCGAPSRECAFTLLHASQHHTPEVEQLTLLHQLYAEVDEGTVALLSHWTVRKLSPGTSGDL